jgi:hypothetical protein
LNRASVFDVFFAKRERYSFSNAFQKKRFRIGCGYRETLPGDIPMSTTSATTNAPNPYKSALENATSESYEKLSFGKRVSGWLEYKLAGLGKGPKEKAEALFEKMKTKIIEAKEDTNKKGKISERYGRALAAAVNFAFKSAKKNHEEYINNFAEKAKQIMTDRSQENSITDIVNSLLGMTSLLPKTDPLTTPISPKSAQTRPFNGTLLSQDSSPPPPQPQPPPQPPPPASKDPSLTATAALLSPIASQSIVRNK